MSKQAEKWNSRIIRYENARVDQITANPKNFRIHPQHQRDALDGVIREVGVVQNVIINERTGNLVDGHLRVDMAIANGEETVPATIVDLSESEEALILSTIDPLSALATTDANKLDELLRDVRTNDQSIQELLTDLAENAGILPPETGDGANEELEPVEDDKLDELQKKWGTEFGQIWVAGKHRVMCGDSTNEEHVRLLAGGIEKFDVCQTDPPYGLGDTKSNKNNYETHNDSVENLKNIIDKTFPIAEKMAKVTVLTSGTKNQWLYKPPTWTMAWFCPAGTGVGAWGFCCWQPILCYGKDPKLAKGMGSHPDAIVHTETSEKLGHPCNKPIGFWSWLMKRVSEEGESIYDPFLGSGTTAVACERNGRICYGMEIDPKYVAVILERLKGEGLEPRIEQ